MIIVIEGPQGSGKTSFAKKMAEHTFPQVADFIDEIPKKKPGHLCSLTIFTHQSDQDIPKWLLGRKDYTVIRINAFNNLYEGSPSPSK